MVRACRTLNVPRPSGGYWYRLAHGGASERPPLPPLPTGAVTEIELGTRMRPDVADAPEGEGSPEEEAPAAEREVEGAPAPVAAEAVGDVGVRERKSAAPAITVAETLHREHPLIARTRRLLESNKADKTGLVEVPWRERVLSVTVSKAQIHRALRIMDAVMKAVEGRGGTFVKVDEKERAFMRLKIRDDFVGIGIWEVVEKTEREPKDEKERESWSWRYDKWQHRPTGKLKFQIFESEPKNGRKSWGDCALYKLEAKVGEMVEWVFVTAEGVTKARLAWEEVQRRRAEEHRQWVEAEHRRLIERRHREALLERASQWVAAQNLRGFIGACERKLLGARVALPPDGWETRWLAWAREKRIGLTRSTAASWPTKSGD